MGRAEAVQGALCLLSIPSRATSAAACFLQPRCPAAALRCAVPAAGADPDQTRRPTAVGTRADGRARPAGIVPAIDGDCGDD
ncbi:MAG: hypothetical protein BWX69_02635 [Planctomycetes bacterium ADurb.Bin069]|nr:MAG: hypothetical protein BWX69_02635 [Planctomycetes bacterium ADurb.Bin069]